jgi:hypothetical protein
LEIVSPTKPESYGHGGFQRRLEGLKVRRIEQNKAVIIVADNDEDPGASFNNIQTQIKRAGGYDVPEIPYKLSGHGALPPVAVIMLPAAGQKGSLDTLCLSALNKAYIRNLDCINALVRCVGATEEDCGVVQFAKLQVQCILSTICQGDPYTPLKFAWEHEPAKKRPGDIFPLTNGVFDPIARFLEEVSA